MRRVPLAPGGEGIVLTLLVPSDVRVIARMDPPAPCVTVALLDSPEVDSTSRAEVAPVTFSPLE